ncbi:MAG: hypothetical protein MZU79_04755 [Anaerotruncus sp.]|nr:hypothetical protein [Anaerotruncus sp.]
MTSELERIKILEGKIGQVVDHIHKLTAENEKLRQQVKETRTEKKEFEESARKLARLDEEMKKYDERAGAPEGEDRSHHRARSTSWGYDRTNPRDRDLRTAVQDPRQRRRG